METNESKRKETSKNNVKVVDENKKKLNKVIKAVNHTEKLMQMIQNVDDFDPLQEAIETLLEIAKILKEQREKETLSKNKKGNKSVNKVANEILNDTLLTIDEVQKITKESKQTIYKRIRNKEIEAYMLGETRQIRVWMSELMKFIHKNRFDL